MATTTSDLIPRIRRCAVCKIDLKGRFVFVDDASEELFGLSREDLFGKSFLDFVGSADQELITHIIRQRNHYESFFESTRVVLVGAAGNPSPSTVVISLNYIAGNPVNFQLVINADPTVSEPGRVVESTAVVDEFLGVVLGANLPKNWARLVASVCAYTETPWMIVYRIHGHDLEPLAAASPFGVLEPPLLEIPPTTPLHGWLAISGEEYAFTDAAAVRRAIERAGAAPNEYAGTIAVAPDQQVLFRFVFAGDPIPAEVPYRPLVRAQLAVDLIRRSAIGGAVLQVQQGTEDLDQVIDQMGSRLGLACCHIDHLGSLIGNLPFQHLVGQEHHLAARQDLINLLAQTNPPDVVEALALIDRYAVDSRGHGVLTARLRENIWVQIVALPGRTSEIGRNHCLLFIPVEPTALRECGAVHLTDLAGIIDSLQSSLAAAHRTAERLAHECFERLSGDGNFYLESLTERLGRMQGMLADTANLLALVHEIEPRQTIDLNLLLRQLSDQLRATRNIDNLSVRFHDLPKLNGSPRKLQAIVREILTNAAMHSAGRPVEVSVTAATSDGFCQLEFTDSGPGIAEKYLPQVTDFFYRVPDATVLATPGRGFGLALVRVLVDALQGTLDIRSSLTKGTTICLRLPV